MLPSAATCVGVGSGADADYTDGTCVGLVDAGTSCPRGLCLDVLPSAATCVGVGTGADADAAAAGGDGCLWLHAASVEEVFPMRVCVRPAQC